MRRRVLVRGGLVAAAALVMVLALPATPRAEASPWDCGGGYHGRGGFGCGGGLDPCAPSGPRGACGPHGRFARRSCYTWRSAARFLARGQGWYLLRRSLHRIQISPTHWHPRCFLYRRYPCRLGNAVEQPVWGGRRCIGRDFPYTECPVALYALGSEEEPALPTAELAPEDRLLRAMERFYQGAYPEAAEDFRGALLANAKDARAAHGMFLCALMLKDWTSAGRALQRIHALGELHGADRLEMDSAFVEPERFTNLRDALGTLAKWKFHETDLQLVAGWAYVATGETDVARGYLRSALRFDRNNAVAMHLLATMDDEAPGETGEPATASPTAKSSPDLAQVKR
jgi:tetratricopeptide (TPR) repeat protein